MIEPVTIGDATLLTGDVIECLKTLPDESVQCVVTSPPYWGLRDYGVEGMIGLEPTFQEWLDRMVEVCREVRRVLRKDGTFWLNCGDAYASNNTRNPNTTEQEADNRKRASEKGYSSPAFDITTGWNRNTGGIPQGLKAKDLMMMPARLAIALQEDGWWVRSDIIWSKPNPMPESVTDRPTSAHEHVFLLTRSARYFYDADAVREPLSRPEELTRANPAVFGGKNKHSLIDNRKYSRRPYTVKSKRPDGWASHEGDHGSIHKDGREPGARAEIPTGRNLRNVWTIATQPYPEAHFATFPEALVRPCIMAGTSEKGCCPECGAPWVRVVEKSRSFESGSGRSGNMPIGKNGPDLQGGGETLDIRRGPCVHTETLGWQPGCDCDAGDPVPCTVLDPFCGSCTTGLVSLKLGRRYIGTDLNPDYLPLRIKRIESEARQEKLF